MFSKTIWKIMPVQLRDVAKRLKLSITTGSRALDGYDDVATTTRARVLRAARAMEYVPSRAARQMRRNRSEVMGYVLPASAGHFADSSFSEFSVGPGDGAATRDFDLPVSTTAADSVIEKRNYTRWIRSRLVDGIVLSRMRLRDWRVAHLVTAHVPFVAHGRTLTCGKYPYIEVDSRSGFEELVGHLVQRGLRRIAYIGAPPEITLQAERFAGYRNGLASAGISFEESLVVEGDLTRQGGYAEHAQPPLTTLQKPIYNTTKRLVDMLVACINGEPLEELKVIRAPQLIIRDSTGGQQFFSTFCQNDLRAAYASANCRRM
jgi:DNA-binding LacI/PurR family transcriptional regulator